MTKFSKYIGLDTHVNDHLNPRLCVKKMLI